MPYRYVALLRSKAGEVTALQNLTTQAKQRIFPIVHLVIAPPITFVQKLSQAWSLPMALDGLFNFAVTGSTNSFIATLSALRHAGVLVVPSVECDVDQRYIRAAQRFVTQRYPNLVVKATLRQLPTLQSWTTTQGWQTNNIDLVIAAGHVADYGSSQFERYVSHVLQNDLQNPGSWRSVTLASSAAPKDNSALQVGRNDVPRLDWSLWKNIHAQFSYQLDYGDYGIAHPDLTEPPGIAMARATVSVRYTVDDSWIILKGNPTSGSRGQPMPTQYRGHARTLHNDPQFGGLQRCWANQRITNIATQAINSGSRTTWVEIGVNRHLSLVADRLP